MKYNYNSLNRVQKAAIIAGVASILLAVLCNTYLLGYLFSEDHRIEFPNTFLIGLFQVLAFSWGVCVILFVRKPRIIALLWGIAISFVLLASIEGISYLPGKFNPVSITESSSPPLFYEDYKIGFELNKNLNARACKVFNGDTVFDVYYHTDSFGRRLVTDVQRTDSLARNNFIAFFGCSRIFGKGLNDEETLPSYTQTFLKDFKVYNYAVSGYGTQQVYAQIMERPLEKEIREAKGIGLYNFSEDHIYRTIGSMDVYNGWGKNMPYYEVEGDSILFHGSFTTGRKFTSFIYALLGKSNFLKKIHFNLPLSYSKEDIELVTKLILQSEKKFKSRFPGSQFYVTLYPTWENPEEIKKILEGNGIKVIDLSKLFDAGVAGYFIKDDGHPSRLANEVIAKALTDTLTKLYKPGL